MGRPWKYNRLIEALEEDELYHTAKVIKHGVSVGLFDHSFDEEAKALTGAQRTQAMKNARSSLAHFAARHLPKLPDGYLEVTKPYRGTFPLFYGRTWKKALIARLPSIRQ